MRSILSFLLLLQLMTVKAQGPLHFLTLNEAEDKIIFSLPHYLKNDFSGKVLDVEDGAFSGDAKGKKTQLYEKHGPIILGSDGLNQLWYIIPSGIINGKQSFRFLNGGYMNFLTAGGGSGFSENSKGADNNEQKWFIAQDDFNRDTKGFYFISTGLQYSDH